jgi:hypothetical protein
MAMTSKHARAGSIVWRRDISAFTPWWWRRLVRLVAPPLLAGMLGPLAAQECSDGCRIVHPPIERDPCAGLLNCISGHDLVQFIDELSRSRERPSGLQDRGQNPNPTPPAADSNTSAKSRPDSPNTCAPVKLSTGEKLLPQTDLRTAGVYGFELTRTYRSQQRTGRLFGPNWTSNYDPARLTVQRGQIWTPYGLFASAMTLVQADGTTWEFVLDEVYQQGCPPNVPACPTPRPNDYAAVPWTGRETLTRDSLPTPQSLPVGTPIYRAQGAAATGFIAVTRNPKLLRLYDNKTITEFPFEGGYARRVTTDTGSLLLSYQSGLVDGV